MKITCNKRDDILKRKQEYESDRAQRQAKYDEQERAYRNEAYGREQSLKKAVIDAIGSTSLDLTVDVSLGFRSSYEIRISDEDNKFDENKALSWDWRVYLDKNGNVKKESSSWSGLNAVSETNLSNLKEIVRVLEVLNNIDFKTILNDITPPEYSEYLAEPNPKYESHENFDKMLLEADVEDLIGTRVGIKGTESKYYRGAVYHIIQSETDKSFMVRDVPAYYAENYEGNLYKMYADKYDAYRMSKDKFYNTMLTPLTTIDFSK